MLCLQGICVFGISRAGRIIDHCFPGLSPFFPFYYESNPPYPRRFSALSPIGDIGILHYFSLIFHFLPFLFYSMPVPVTCHKGQVRVCPKRAGHHAHVKSLFTEHCFRLVKLYCYTHFLVDIWIIHLLKLFDSTRPWVIPDIKYEIEVVEICTNRGYWS